MGGSITLGFCHQSKPYVHLLSCPLPRRMFFPYSPSLSMLLVPQPSIHFIYSGLNCLKVYFPHQIQTSRKTGPCSSQLSVPQPGPLLLCKSAHVVEALSKANSLQPWLPHLYTSTLTSLRLPDLASENTGQRIKYESQVNNE